jgi:hypothetical protein
MPDARCTRGPVCKMGKETHTSIQVQRRRSDISCAMVLRRISSSPRRSGFLVTVTSQVSPTKLDAGVEASGPHDFAVRIRRCRQQHHPRPPHPAPTFVTMANAPLSGRDGHDIELIWISEKQKYFLRRGLDRANHVDRLREISFSAQRLASHRASIKRRWRKPKSQSWDHTCNR